MRPQFVATMISASARALLAVALLLDGGLLAQGAPAPPRAVPPEPTPLADNSFLIEEAYNQGKGVVQHISSFAQQRAGAWSFTFTQEWPVGGQRHQLSYSIGASRIGPGATGLGDVVVNYRYQALANENAGLFFSPRLSVSLPTGNAAKGLGTGVVGFQAEAPLSVAITKTLVAHSNAGYALFPGARPGGVPWSVGTLNLGQSLVWLALPRFNFLFEAAWTGTTRARGGGVNVWESTFVLNPGVRWGYDFDSGLQIVPGVSFPIGVGPSRGQQQILLYLSLEHAFRRSR